MDGIGKRGDLINESGEELSEEVQGSDKDDVVWLVFVANAEALNGDDSEPKISSLPRSAEFSLNASLCIHLRPY